MPDEAAARQSLIVVYLCVGVLVRAGAGKNEMDGSFGGFQGPSANDVAFPVGTWLFCGKDLTNGFHGE
jgi:hypothetical protein